MTPRPWLVVALIVVLAGAYLTERSHRSALELEIAARDRSVLVLRHVVTRDTAAVTVAEVRWRTLTHVDTLPGRVDTLPVVRQIVAAGDTLAARCDTAIHSALALSDTLTAQTKALAKLAGGPWIHPAVELTTGSAGILPAAEVSIGHRLQLLARAEIPLTQTPTWRVGVRLTF